MFAPLGVGYAHFIRRCAFGNGASVVPVVDDAELRGELGDRLLGRVVEDDAAGRLPCSAAKVNTAVAGRGSRAAGTSSMSEPSIGSN